MHNGSCMSHRIRRGSPADPLSEPVSVPRRPACAILALAVSASFTLPPARDAQAGDLRRGQVLFTPTAVTAPRGSWSASSLGLMATGTCVPQRKL